MVQQGYFGILGNTLILVDYLIILSQNIEVRRVETMDMDNIPMDHWFQCNIQM